MTQRRSVKAFSLLLDARKIADTLPIELRGVYSY